VDLGTHALVSQCMAIALLPTAKCRPSCCYARKQLLLSASLSHRNSVCSSVCPFVRLSVTRMNQSKTAQARITKSSPSAAKKFLVSLR